MTKKIMEKMSLSGEDKVIFMYNNERVEMTP